MCLFFSQNPSSRSIFPFPPNVSALISPHLQHDFEHYSERDGNKLGLRRSHDRHERSRVERRPTTRIRSRARDVHGVDTTQEMQVNGAVEAGSFVGFDPRCIHPGSCTSYGSIRGTTPHQFAPSFTLSKSRISSAPERRKQRQEEVNSRVSRPQVAKTQEQHPHQSQQPTAPLTSRGVEDPYLLLAVTPPRRSPFSPVILAEALSAGVKVSNLPEYDGTGDPQEHLDKFYAKIDWYDFSDAAYCKVFHTTLSKRALAWFNQLSAGTISSIGQLTQRFLHHFSMNKKVPKTIAYLFTVRQREKESLRDYVQRFMEAVHEKYIRIEKSNVSDSSLSVKRKGQEEEREPKKEERKYLAPRGFTHYTPLNALRGEILVVAKQQRLISQRPRKMQDNPKRLKLDKIYRFHRDMGHTTEECHHLQNEIEKLIQRGHLKEYIKHYPQGFQFAGGPSAPPES
ncbi:UNVERIFIED_CONTAM: hypothetical protein Slati_1279700 [Sesamum latifolium]|uniref:Retrotransposon gag domain-containing protein n=1 Tax=Sesamum latifolium TaxID=2727402 RepID=A0AAW2XJL2_9LAMI